MKEILLYDQENNDSLFYRADEIDITKQGKEMREIVHEIKDTMRKKNLKHLSAPAIGYSKRIFCIDFEDLEIKTYINPIIVDSKGLILSKETSSCIPNKEYIIPRNTEVTVMYQTPLGKPENRQFLGMAALVIQQELQALDGVLISDIGLEIDDDYTSATDEEKEKIIEMYLDSLDLKAKKVEEEVNKDEKLKELSDGIRFMEGVARGEIVQSSQEK